MTPRGRAALAWYAVTALNCGLALLIQLVLVAKGHHVLVEPDGSTAGAPERLLRFFSYFTMQSNILAAITTGILAAASWRRPAISSTAPGGGSPGSRPCSA